MSGPSDEDAALALGHKHRKSAPISIHPSMTLEEEDRIEEKAEESPWLDARMMDEDDFGDDG